MPALIVLAALSIFWWSSRRNLQAIGVIQQHVQQLCNDAAGGSNIADRLNNSNPLVASQTADEIKDAWRGPPNLSREVMVTSGDVPQFNLGTATHTAMLRVNGKDVLGLRILNKDVGGPIEILGYWRP